MKKTRILKEIRMWEERLIRKRSQIVECAAMIAKQRGSQ
jgi:hypothetical protein